MSFEDNGTCRSVFIVTKASRIFPPCAFCDHLVPAGITGVFSLEHLETVYGVSDENVKITVETDHVPYARPSREVTNFRKICRESRLFPAIPGIHVRVIRGQYVLGQRIVAPVDMYQGVSVRNTIGINSKDICAVSSDIDFGVVDRNPSKTGTAGVGHAEDFFRCSGASRETQYSGVGSGKEGIRYHVKSRLIHLHGPISLFQGHILTAYSDQGRLIDQFPVTQEVSFAPPVDLSPVIRHGRKHSRGK